MNKLEQIKTNVKNSDEHMLNVSKSDVEWLIETIESYERRYENTGAIFNRQNMKRQIEEQQQEIEHLKFVMRKYDKYANWSYAEKYGVEL